MGLCIANPKFPIQIHPVLARDSSIDEFWGCMREVFSEIHCPCVIIREVDGLSSTDARQG